MIRLVYSFFSYTRRIILCLVRFWLYASLKYVVLGWTSDVVTMSIKGHKIHLRWKTSDRRTFDQVFLDNEYKADYVWDISTIVDAWANIWLSAIWFHLSYPDARIYSIEPQEENFALLTKNCANISNITLLHNAIRPVETELSLENWLDMGYWGCRYDALTHGTWVHTVTLPWLFDSYSFESIDILKVDIEWAEKELFEKNISWIQRVSNIAIELHDRFKHWCSYSFFSSVKALSYSYFQRWENIFLLWLDKDEVPA